MTKKNTLSFCILILMMVSILGLCYVWAGSNSSQTSQSDIQYNVPSGIRWNQGMNCFQVFSSKGVSYIGSNENVSSSGEILAVSNDSSNIASPDSTYYIMQDISYDAAVSLDHSTSSIIFTGVLEGRGLTITAFPIVANGSEYTALFSENQGTIKNLNIVNPTIPESVIDITAGIFAFKNSGIIDNCSVSFNSQSTTAIDFANTFSEFGAFVHTNIGTIKKSTTEGKISLTQNAGGFSYLSANDDSKNGTYLNLINNLEFSGGNVVGGITATSTANNTTITACNNMAVISGNSTTSNIGGLVGSSNGTLTIKDSQNNGAITGYITGGIVANAISSGTYNFASLRNNASIYANLRSAGIINTTGEQFTNLTSTYCNNSGEVSAEIGGQSYQISCFDSGVLINCTSLIDADEKSATLYTFMPIDTTAYSIAKGEETKSQLVIPSEHLGLPVTTIINNGFINNTLIRCVTIPSSITSIGTDAFTGCTNLFTVCIDSSVVANLDYSQTTGIFNNADSVYVKQGLTVGSAITDNFVKTEEIDGYDVYSKATINLDYTEIIIGSVATSYSVSNGTTTATKILIPLTHLGLPITEITENGFKDKTLISSIKIPESVIIIGNNAFKNCSSLLNITIPNNVTSIGQNAFNSCANLITIILPDSLTIINDYAFFNCLSLTNLIIPKNVTSIGKHVFEYCLSLTSIILPYSISNLGEGAFSCCSSLEHVFLPLGLINIQKDTFASCIKLKNILLPSSVETIGSRAFSYTGLTKVSIFDSSLTSIGDEAFSNCKDLIELPIVDSVTSIGIEAFYKCSSLINIKLLSSITNIGIDAFENCNNINKVYIDNNYVANLAFNELTKTFKYAENLYVKQSLTVGTAISLYFTKIDESNGYDIYSKATNNINKVYIDNSYIANLTYNETTNVLDYAENVYVKQGLIVGTAITDNFVKIDENDDYKIYSKATKNLVYIEIGSPVTSYSVSYGTATVTKILIPSTHLGLPITEISENGFKNKTEISSISIPDSVTIIGNYAFQSCTNLLNIIIPNNVTSIGNASFDNCSLTNIIIPNNVTNIGDSAFRNCSSLTNIIISNSVTSISDYTFYKCISLKNINLTNGVTSIGSSSFSGCSSLSNIILPSFLTSIGDCAFQNCLCLSNIILSSNLTSIGDYAFQNCMCLSNIILPSLLTSIGEYAFQNCNTLKNIILTEALETIGDYAFQNCLCLSNLVLTDGLETIGNAAFFNCTNLNTLKIPSNVTTIGSLAFYGCVNLKELYVDSSVIAKVSTNIGDIYSYPTTIYVKTAIGSVSGSYITSNYSQGATISGYVIWTKN